MSVIQPHFDNPAEWVKWKYDQQEGDWFNFFLRAASIGMRSSSTWPFTFDQYVWPVEFWEFFERKEIERMKREFTFRKGQRVGYNLATFRNDEGNAVVQINERGPCHHCFHHRWHKDVDNCCWEPTCSKCGITHVVIPF